MPSRRAAVAEYTFTSIERATPNPTPTVVPETEGRPRRETRRPIKYADYKCYTLQSTSDQPEGREERSIAIGGSVTNHKIEEKQNSRELVHSTQVLNVEQMHQ